LATFDQENKCQAKNKLLRNHLWPIILKQKHQTFDCFLLQTFDALKFPFVPAKREISKYTKFEKTFPKHRCCSHRPQNQKTKTDVIETKLSRANRHLL
jgi:hypothetical protein